jgi:hypothetical protein
MLIVAYKPFMLSVVMPNVAMLIVVAPPQPILKMLEKEVV